MRQIYHGRLDAYSFTECFIVYLTGHLDVVGGVGGVMECFDMPKGYGYNNAAFSDANSKKSVNYCPRVDGDAICAGFTDRSTCQAAAAEPKGCYWDYGSPAKCKVNTVPVYPDSARTEGAFTAYVPPASTNGDAASEQAGCDATLGKPELVPAISGGCRRAGLEAGAPPADILGVRDCGFGWPNMRVSWRVDCEAKKVHFDLEMADNGTPSWMALGIHDAGTADVPVALTATRMNGADIVRYAPAHLMHLCNAFTCLACYCRHRSYMSDL